jgi:hypothetical protein
MKTMKYLILLSLILITVPPAEAQTNMFLSNPVAGKILNGNYDPAIYRSGKAVSHPDSVRFAIIRGVDQQEQAKMLDKLESFYNRNSGADTTSLTKGIGACRSWILSCFDEASRKNNNRLVTGYLEFDADICGKTHHKNPFALLPGLDTSCREIIVVEGHFDTRNEVRCDTTGFTPGVDDNGSGATLVIELARVMSRFSFNQTILFTTPTGEDEGLFGAKAWADFLSASGVEIRAVLNSDIVGGIYCGKTSPAPSCPFYGHVDSTHVRIFSYSADNSLTVNSQHKQLARYMKYLQDSLINPHLAVPMTVNIMQGEDRSGRGGDHTPFRKKGYTSVRVISANEHGNGTGTPPDRNHSIRDRRIQDITGDGIADSLFVNPGYLARNTIMVGVTAALLASAPQQITAAAQVTRNGAVMRLSSPLKHTTGLLVGVRKFNSQSLEFDTILRLPYSKEFRISLDAGQTSYVSVAPVNNGAPGLFSNEMELILAK